MKPMTAPEIARACGALPADALLYGEALNEAMARYDINTKQRRAAFLATVAVESAYLSKVQEGLFYRDPARLVAIFPRAFKTVEAAQPYTKNPHALSKLLYEGYHGRGLIQLTWQKNYEAFGKAVGMDFVQTPDLLVNPKWAALSAGWFWKTNGCNELADRGDMDAITRVVNGPKKLHLAERVASYDKAMQWLA
jgi:putative chitinase